MEPYYNVFIASILIFSTFYALNLIFDLIYRCVQAYKIIPEFITWYNKGVKNISSIITFYYIQNILFMLLSGWILYVILTKLNLFVEDIYLFIITIGIMLSIIFIYYYPLHKPNIPTVGYYPFYIYLLFILFIIFYIFAIPLIMINVINSDKFINFFSDYYIDCIKRSYSYMNNPNTDNDNNTTGVLTIRDNNSIKVTSESNEDINIIGNNKVEVSKGKRIHLQPSTSTSTAIPQPTTTVHANFYHMRDLVFNTPQPSTSQRPHAIGTEGVINNISQSQSNGPLTLSQKRKTVPKNLLDYYKIKTISNIELPSSCEALTKNVIKPKNVIVPKNVITHSYVEENIQTENKKFNLLTYLSSIFGFKNGGIKTLTSKVSIAPTIAENIASSSNLQTIPRISTPINESIAPTIAEEIATSSNLQTIPRISIPIYESMIDNINKLIYILEGKYKLTPMSYLQLDLSEHLKELEVRLEFNQEAQLILMNLNKIEIDNINSIINSLYSKDRKSFIRERN